MQAGLPVMLEIRNLGNLRITLLTYNRNDCQVGANRADLGYRCEPEWQATPVITDPASQLKLVRLSVVSGKRYLNSGDRLRTQLHSFSLQGSEGNCLWLVVHQN